MSEKPKHPGGRPTKYNEEIAARVCEIVATHPIGLKKLCKMYDEMPDDTTINLWRYTHVEFSRRYAQAKIFQSELLAEECLDIADFSENDSKSDIMGNEVCDTEYIARSRLRVDTRKWLASKLAPKIYGDTARLAEPSSSEDTLNKIKTIVADFNKTNESDI